MVSEFRGTTTFPSEVSGVGSSPDHDVTVVGFDCNRTPSEGLLGSCPLSSLSRDFYKVSLNSRSWDSRIPGNFLVLR